MLQRTTLQFLKDLKKNNVKEWFDANRKAYDAARADVANLVATAVTRHGTTDEDIASLQPKDCMFRINRDVRFSKNKMPYKTNFGAGIGRGGKKSIYAGYYIHIEPGNESFAGGGLWMPEAEQLKKVRQEIDYNFSEFSNIINDKKFKAVYPDFYTGENSKLSRPPKGYDEYNPAIEFIKLKSFIVLHPVTDAELTGKQLSLTIQQAFQALYPLLRFINTAIES